MADTQRFIKRLSSIVANKIDGEVKSEAFFFADPPSGASALKRVEKFLPYSIPNPLRTFFLKGSAEVRFRYRWQPSKEVMCASQNIPPLIYGGMHICFPDPVFSIFRMYDYVEDARDYASWSGISDFPEEQEIWNRAAPFFRWNNFDFLAFDSIVDPIDPYVIYLSHESGSHFLSRNLASFLIEWQRCCYFGPGDIYHLRPFLDSETKALSGDTLAAQELRKVLGMKS